MRAPNLPVLFHPDCNRRLRNRTESADPADCSAGARGLWRSLAITAGGDFHPAPRTRSDRNPTGAIKASLVKPYNHFRQPNGQACPDQVKPRTRRCSYATSSNTTPQTAPVTPVISWGPDGCRASPSPATFQSPLPELMASREKTAYCRSSRSAPGRFRSLVQGSAERHQISRDGTSSARRSRVPTRSE